MIQKITVNNLEIGELSTGFIIKSLKGFGMPRLNTEVASRGHYHGSNIGYSYYEGRVLLIEGRIIGSSPEDYQEKRKKLSENLDAMLDQQYVYFELRSGKILRIRAILGKEIEMPYEAGNMVMGSFSFQLVTDSHLFEDMFESTEEITVFEVGGFSVPFDVPLDMDDTTDEFGGLITNGGNGFVFPTFTFTGTAENITLTNQSTGEIINIEYAITDGDELVVDTYNRVAMLNGTTNVSQYITGYWIKLKPGLNIIRLTAETYTDTASVSVNYRDGYITI